MNQRELKQSIEEDPNLSRFGKGAEAQRAVRALHQNER